MVPWTWLYPLPPAAWINILSVIMVVSFAHGGWKEIWGNNLQYSKLKDNNNKKKKNINDDKAKEVPSKVGMFVFYAPSLVAGLSSFAIFPLSAADFRFTAICSAITLHFLKRVLEVLLVHKYSGSIDTNTVISVSLCYFTYSATVIYNQHLILQLGVSQPTIDLKYIGIPLFLLGISGNFYHHYLLSTLRKNKGSEKRYEIPRGGLFSLVICPHYLFEIIGFVGIACISQSVFAFSGATGTVFFLVGRSYATRKWYESKFEKFPKETKSPPQNQAEPWFHGRGCCTDHLDHALSVIIFVSWNICGWVETRGKHLLYSKLRDSNNKKKNISLAKATGIYGMPLLSHGIYVTLSIIIMTVGMDWKANEDFYSTLEFEEIRNV